MADQSAFMSSMKAQRTSLTASSLLALNESKRNQYLAKLTTKQRAALRYNWLFWARDNQLLPDELLTSAYNIWLIMAGRGYGKTRTGAETVRWLVEHCGYRHIAIVARTAGDVRDVMVEGQSGLMSVYPAWDRPVYEPSKRRITFSNGAVATTYSADKPDQLRGPNTDLVWGDELAAWRYEESFDQVQFGNRIGTHPLQIYTTTPRPTPLIRELMNDPACIVTRGNTFENVANLAASALSKLKRKYQNTRLGRQELYAEVLDDVPGALWTRSILEKSRVQDAPELKRIVVAIDPATTANEGSNDTGIVVAGIDGDGAGYVLDDVTVSGSPDHWARVAVYAYYQYEADKIVAESNQGGDMVEHTIRSVDKNVPVKLVRATRGKYTRAEPVSALYEQGRVHHVGFLAELEDQLCTWLPGEDSPDRLDALVWAMTELMVKEEHVLRRRRGNRFTQRR